MYEEYDSCDFFFFFFSSPFLGACAGAERSEAENVRSRERFFRRRAVSAARAPAGRRPDEARGRARGNGAAAAARKAGLGSSSRGLPRVGWR